MSSIIYEKNDCAIFIVNLPIAATKNDIGRHFEYIGLVLNVTYNKEKRYAYVQYKWMSEAIKAIEVFNCSYFMGKCIFVSIHKGNKFIKDFPTANPKQCDDINKRKRNTDDMQEEKSKHRFKRNSNDVDSD